MSETEWPTLYVKTAAGNINYWKIWTLESGVYTEWGKVGTDKPLTDVYDAVGKNVGRKNETTPAEQAKLEAQSKYDKQLRLKYVHSIEDAKTNINVKPMRAYTLDDKRAKKMDWDKPVSVQPKFNGVRCMAYNLPDGTVRLMSRGGKDYVLPHIQDELKGLLRDGWALDGELYVHQVSLQNIRSYIETPSPKTLMVQFICYDCTELPPNKKHNWGRRFAKLVSWFQSDATRDLEHVEISPSDAVYGMDEVRRLHEQWTSNGFEGVMVRTMKGTYRMAAKSVDLLKFKDHEDAEFVVIGWSTGKDGVVKYRCVQEQGLEFEVRPMGNEKERAELLATANDDVGKMLTVRFQERSDDNIPIHGRGVAFRPQKDMD
jgi:DNA ligase-1